MGTDQEGENLGVMKINLIGNSLLNQQVNFLYSVLIKILQYNATFWQSEIKIPLLISVALIYILFEEKLLVVSSWSVFTNQINDYNVIHLAYIFAWMVWWPIRRFISIDKYPCRNFGRAPIGKNVVPIAPDQ